MTELPPQPPTVLLEARGISRTFGRVVAVHKLDISLQRGDVTGFLGLNGAGKSTTLRMLCGTLAADSGEILIDGIDLRSDPQAARARLGFLPDRPPLYPELSVDEFLTYCARLRIVPRSRIADSIRRVKQQTGLESHGERRIAGLSRGYRQRLGIAQAIVHQPSVVVLDEPTTGLDPRQNEEIRALITSLSESAAVLLSTHLLAEVRAVCNRVAIIHAGEIAHQSAIGDLGHNTVRVAFREPIERGRLDALTGVSAVAGESDNVWLIDAASTDTVQSAALEQGWGLVSLSPVDDALEHTFFRITGADYQ